jgi:ubiquinone/menaquinone biosynthesis C-methylase UbiE
MRFFFWRRPQTNTVETARSRRWVWLGGRRILTNTPYIMPKDKLEGDRLDLQHHLFKLAAGGNYRAPIRQPREILDVACGTGIWGREMAQEFKRARVIGFDIDPTLPERAMEILGPGGQFPPNFRFQVADALKPFPFADGEFDFVHARLISPFVPIARWPDVLAEMMRVLKPGGIIEVVDMEQTPQTPSKALMTLGNYGLEMMRQRGLFTGVGDALPGLLEQAGATRIQQRKFVLGADLRQRRLLAADMLAAIANIKPLMIREGRYTEEEFEALYTPGKAEVMELGITMPIVFCFGQKF